MYYQIYTWCSQQDLGSPPWWCLYIPSCTENTAAFFESLYFISSETAFYSDFYQLLIGGLYSNFFLLCCFQLTVHHFSAETTVSESITLLFVVPFHPVSVLKICYHFSCMLFQSALYLCYLLVSYFLHGFCSAHLKA